MILDKINKANDIKKVSPEKYDELATELRNYIIDTVGSNGGHLSSSLGVVELTMALHLALDLPKDKIIWDVGHQSYAHKILSGRKNEFKTLRQYGGISGFPSMKESKYDSFGTGHASTSISAAIGMAQARELSGENNTIVAVIGDGALTGGMAFEALNNASAVKGNLIIILNDNDMSISKSVGGTSRLLTRLRTDKMYNIFKENIKSGLENIPGCGRGIVKRIHRTKSSIKQLFVPGMFFEELGITYLGPVDGHNIQKMIRLIRQAQNLNHAVLIHVNTHKGNGYYFAEKNPSLFHGVEPFNTDNGQLINNEDVRTYSDVFSAAIMRNAKLDKRIVAITAAMADGTGLKKFQKVFKNRFFDVGIAEEHAVTFAAGLAAEGYKPYVAIYSSFLQRSIDQILHDVCIQNLPVRFIVERAGIVGRDGVTHQGIFDLSYLGMIPNLTILAPKNRYELKSMIDYSVDFDGPIAIRFPRGKASEVYAELNAPIEYGRAEIVEEGKEVAILAVGSEAEDACRVSEILAKYGIKPTVVNMRFVKPFDAELVEKLANNNRLIVTMEENVLSGGFGQSILTFINEKGINTGVLIKSLRNEFIEHGRSDELKAKYGLDVNEIAQEIVRRIRK